MPDRRENALQPLTVERRPHRIGRGGKEENRRRALENGDNRRYVEVQVRPHRDFFNLGAIG
ncbi:hypothetical protein D9M69_561760 [compost metagenome]